MADHWLDTPSAHPSQHVRYVRGRALACWVLPHIGDHELEALTPAVMDALMQKLLRKGLKLSSVKMVLRSVFGSMWIRARVEGLVGDNPCDGLHWPALDHDLPDPFTADERDAIIAWYRRHHPLLLPFVQFAFWTGMRPGEVAGLRWPDYEPSTGRITVARALVAREQVPPKTKRSKRTITLEPEARAAIEMVHQRRPWIFTWELGSRQ